MAWIGWTAHIPVSGVESYLPLGYRIVATILALVSLPLAAAAGAQGAGYGRANSQHFDARRATLLGVRWYHVLWLPLLIHMMIAIATFGAVYGFQWFLVVLRNGFSLLVLIPSAFYIAMLFTLQLLGTGAFRTYEALAGFTDDANTPVWLRVVEVWIRLHGPYRLGPGGRHTCALRSSYRREETLWLATFDCRGRRIATSPRDL